MNRIIILVFLLFTLCLNAENFDYYTEVSEPHYKLIYETGGLYHSVKNKTVSAEDGKYKFIDENYINYLEIKNSKLNGKIFIFDKKTNKKLFEYTYKNGLLHGDSITFDSNIKPEIIENYNMGILINRITFLNGKFEKREVF